MKRNEMREKHFQIQFLAAFAHFLLRSWPSYFDVSFITDMCTRERNEVEKERRDKKSEETIFDIVIQDSIQCCIELM